MPAPKRSSTQPAKEVETAEGPKPTPTALEAQAQPTTAPAPAPGDAAPASSGESPALTLAVDNEAPAEAPPLVKRGRPRKPESELKEPRRERKGPPRYIRPDRKTGEASPDLRAVTSHDRDQQYMATAKMLVDTSTMSFAILLGENWKVTNETEYQALVDATFNYLKATNTPEIPPGMALLMVVTVYATPRLMSAEFRERMIYFKTKLTKKRELTP